METFPYLSVMTFLPMLGALIILFIPHISQAAARSIALLAALGSLVVSVVVLARFDPQAPFEAGVTVPFQERIDWGREVGASYFLGIDGVAILLIVLTTLISVVSIIWSWDTVNTRTREYYIAILLLETGMLGVFVALDMFLFYIFWELMLIPMALLIGIWGSSNRVYAAVKFFLYTLFGSLLMLVGIVATYWAYYQQTGVLTLDVLQLAAGRVRPHLPDLGLPRLLRRLCRQGAPLPLPHLAARCPRRGADRGLGDPGGGHAEDGRLRLPPLQPAALPGGRPSSGSRG